MINPTVKEVKLQRENLSDMNAEHNNDDKNGKKHPVPVPEPYTS